MAKEMSETVAIKKWLEHDAAPITAKEMMEFIKSCNGTQKREYAVVAAQELSKVLGEEVTLGLSNVK